MLVTTGNDLTANWVSCCVVTSESRGGRGIGGRVKCLQRHLSATGLNSARKMGNGSAPSPLSDRRKSSPIIWINEAHTRWSSKFNDSYLNGAIFWEEKRRKRGGKEEEHDEMIWWQLPLKQIIKCPKMGRGCLGEILDIWIFSCLFFLLPLFPPSVSPSSPLFSPVFPCFAPLLPSWPSSSASLSLSLFFSFSSPSLLLFFSFSSPFSLRLPPLLWFRGIPPALPYWKK